MEDTISVTESATRNPLLARYQKETGLAIERWKKPLARIKKNRRLMRGAVDGNKTGDSPDTEEKVRANIIYSTSRTILPSIYAQNPEVQAKPSAQAGSRGELYGFAQDFGETLAIMINYEFHKAGVKKKHKRIIRSAQTSRIGLAKITFQRDFYTDPQVKERLEDSQDDLNELTSRITDLQEASLSTDEEDAKLEELNDLIESLKKQMNVMRSQGMVFDLLDVNNFLIDPAVQSLEDYKSASWMQDKAWLPVGKFKRRYNLSDDDMEGINIYQRPNSDDKMKGWSNSARGKKLEDGWIAVWERWNKSTNTVYTWADGADQFIKEPFQPAVTSERWYPYFLFGLHWIDGLDWPLSDVELLEKLSDEYNSTREMQAEHRGAAVPYLIVAGSQLTPGDVNKISGANGLDIIVLDIEGKNIRELVQDGPIPTFNPAMYDTTGIHQDIGLVSGATDAAKGAILRNKTLGEAEIMQQHLSTRLGELQDESEEFLQEIAEHIAEIILQQYTAEEVTRIAGENAIWPEMDMWEIYNLVDVQIKAGSTGKPDKARDLQQWAEMLPFMLQLIQFGLQFRMQGGTTDPATGQKAAAEDSANPYFNLLEISFKKFDERLDMEAILPPQQPAEQQMPPPQGLPFEQQGQVPPEQQQPEQQQSEISAEQQITPEQMQQYLQQQQGG